MIVEVRGIKIGEGRPKIIIPIVEASENAILEKAIEITKLSADLVEWRADWLDGDDYLTVLSSLRKALGEMPLLFTFRTNKEGGQKAISVSEYEMLCCRVAESGLADLIDVEVFTGEETVKKIIRCAHDHNVKVVASNHDFHATPDKDEIVRRLLYMQELDADIPKIAVMPTCARDVLTLLAATEEMYTDHADRPIITMSMSGKGLVSRLSGEFFGSSCTFGAAGKVSAPGQIDAVDLESVLELIHRSI